MPERPVQFPWESYYRSGLITRRQLLKLSTMLGTAVVVGGEAGMLAAPERAAAAVAPAAQQVLRYPDTEPLHFDPATMEARPEILIGMALFDPLITFDASGHVVPVAAQSWNVSSDGLTYTFHLRSGMQWSDGHPVTASDYEYAWKRVIDPTVASDYASAFYPIKGALAYNKGQTKTADGVGIKALNTLTLQVVLAAPAAYFPRIVSTWNCLPVPALAGREVRQEVGRGRQPRRQRLVHAAVLGARQADRARRESHATGGRSQRCRRSSSR